MTSPVDSIGALQAFARAADGRSFKAAGQTMGSTWTPTSTIASST